MKIVFVCLGNICRSIMAECIMKHLVLEKGIQDKWEIYSRATSDEEEGNPIYYKAKQKLIEKGINIPPHFATKLNKNDYYQYDLFVGMEERNVERMKVIFDGKDDKIIKMKKSVSDPWWTGDFETAYNDILIGINDILEKYNV